MKNWIQQNWFKLLIIVLLTIFIAIYAYDIYESYQPKSLKEKVWQEIQSR